MEAELVQDLRYTLLGADTPALAFSAPVVNIGATNNNQNNIVNRNVNKQDVSALGGSAKSIKLLFTFNAQQLTNAQLEYLKEFSQLALIVKKLLLVSTDASCQNSHIQTAFYTNVNNTVIEFQQFVNNLYIESDKITNFISLDYHLIDWYTIFRHVYWLHLKSKSLSPNEFLSLLYDYSLFSDSLIHSISQTYFQSLLQIYLGITFKWMLLGELTGDAVEESFFILKDKDQPVTFTYNPLLVPSFINTSIAEKIFHIGNSIYYLKYYLNDKIWCNRIFNDYSHLQDLNSTDVNTLYDIVLARFDELILSDFKSEVSNLKNFLLFQNGDLINALLINGSHILNESASALWSNQLITVLQDSIDSSSISKNLNPSVFNRIDARLLNLNSSDSKGWDLFTLDFKLLPQVNYIISSDYKEYLKVFNFLFKFVHLKFDLAESWKLSSTLKLSSVLKSRKLEIYKRKFDLIKHQFTSFINTLFSFIENNILAVNFCQFLDKFNNSNAINLENNKLLPLNTNHRILFNLNSLKSIHKDYIHSISESTLFSSPINQSLYQLILIITKFNNLINEFQNSISDLNHVVKMISTNTNDEDLTKYQNMINAKLDNMFNILSVEIVNQFEINMDCFIKLLKSSKVQDLLNLALILEN